MMFKKLRKKSNTRRRYVVIGVAFAFIFVWFLVDRIVMPLYTRQGSEREIPKLSGLTLLQAQLRAASTGFKLIIEPAKLGGSQPEGTILEQRPMAGALSKQGRSIRVVPAAAPQPNTAPDLVGLDIRDAQLRCRSAGLMCSDSDVRYRFSERSPKGTVVSQEPGPGEKMKPGAAVKITVSMGTQPDHYYVPYLMEKSLHEARSLLREAGLKLGKIVRKETDMYVSGTVIAQSVRSGEEVQGGTAVDVVVAVPKSEVEESEGAE